MKISKLFLSGSGLIILGGIGLVLIKQFQPATDTGVYWQRGFKINRLQTKQQEIPTNLKQIIVDVKGYDLTIIPTNAKTGHIKRTAQTRNYPKIRLSKGVLKISNAAKLTGYQLQFGRQQVSKITLKIPKNKQLQQLVLKNKTSNTNIKQVNVKKVTLQINKGHLVIKNSSIKQLAGQTVKTHLKISKSSVAQMTLASNNSNVALDTIIWHNNSQVISQASNISLNNNRVGGYSINNDNGIINVNQQIYYNLYHSIESGQPILKIDNNQGKIKLKT